MASREAASVEEEQVVVPGSLTPRREVPVRLRPRQPGLVRREVPATTRRPRQPVHAVTANPAMAHRQLRCDQPTAVGNQVVPTVDDDQVVPTLPQNILAGGHDEDQVVPDIDH